MEIKANFIAIKLGSGIHQFLGKISNQGKVQIHLSTYYGTALQGSVPT
jgi:hypothetical protein